MKRWQIISLSVVLLIGLGVRGVYQQIRKVQDVKLEFLQQLHYDFSAKIDTVRMQDKGRRILYVRCVRNQPNPAVEEEINQKTDFVKYQSFLNFTKAGLIKLYIRSDISSLSGDSLYVNTDKDIIIEFRNGKEVLRCAALASLRKRER